MKYLVDVAKLQGDGTITPAQADAIRRAAASETGTLAINIVAALGAFAVVAGLLAMKPTSATVAITGLFLTAADVAVRTYHQARFGFLGSSLIVIGALLLAGGLILKCSGVAPAASSNFLFTAPRLYGHMVIFLVVAIWLAGIGAYAENGLLVALSVFALAGALGSSTGYWHASYALVVREATVTIVASSVLGALASYPSMRIEDPYARLLRLAALICLLWVNFGFWVGSLWGDYPMEGWLSPNLPYTSFESQKYEAYRLWQQNAFFISHNVFALAWALALLAVGAWAARENRRGTVNMAATFGGIHFYTQWFERLSASPQSLILAGVLAVGLAFALWRYNQRQAAAMA